MKNSKWGLGLNHDIITSDRSVPTPTFQKIDPRLRVGYQAKGPAIYPFKAYQGAETLQKHFIYLRY